MFCVVFALLHKHVFSLPLSRATDTKFYIEQPACCGIWCLNQRPSAATKIKTVATNVCQNSAGTVFLFQREGFKKAIARDIKKMRQTTNGHHLLNWFGLFSLYCCVGNFVFLVSVLKFVLFFFFSFFFCKNQRFPQQDTFPQQRRVTPCNTLLLPAFMRIYLLRAQLFFVVVSSMPPLL